MSQVIRVSTKVYSRLENHVKGFENPSKVIERLLDYYEGVEPEKSIQPAQEMNRKQFVQSVGATCKNWTWSWSFINEEEKFILFGAWDNLEGKNISLILSKEWEIGVNGRKLPGYSQALEHIDRILSEGYQLKIFKIIGTNGGSENAKITTIETHMTDKELKRDGDNWYAV